MNQRLLFVGHDAYRAGAQLSLLQLQRWLAANTPLRFETLLCAGGPLVDDYRALGRPVTLLPPWRSGTRHVFARAERRWRLERLRRRNDLIYANTVTNGAVVRRLSRRRPVITHARELQQAIDQWGGDANLRVVLSHTTLMLACAERVKSNLCTRHGVAGDQIRVVRSSIDPLRPSPDTPSAETMRGRLGIPAAAPVIGGCGALAPHKGPDLFIDVAHAMQRAAPRLDAHFVWVGADHGGSLERLRTASERRGLGGRVHFVGEQSRVHDYFQLFDLFAMVSRSDPHPRVCLEAATLGVPSVCFEEGGGIPEFIEDDAGVAVPGWEVAAMAAALVSLLESPPRRRDLGRRAAEKVAARHDVAVIGPQVTSAIESALGRTRLRPAIWRQGAVLPVPGRG